MATKDTSSRYQRDELRKEYAIDYANAAPNRFAGKRASIVELLAMKDGDAIKFEPVPRRGNRRKPR